MPGETAPSSIRWSAHEHEHIERGRDWYMALGVVAVCTAAIAVLFGNILFGVLILIAAATWGLLSKTPPALTEFEISDRGIRIGETMHRYEEIIAFWVEDHDVDPPILLIDTVKMFSPNFVIPLPHGDVDPKVVREFLAMRADEIPMKESFAHKILEFFGL